MESFIICVGQCLWIVNILLVRGDVISWVTSFVALQCKIIHYSVKFRGNINPRVTLEIHWTLITNE